MAFIILLIKSFQVLYAYLRKIDASSLGDYLLSIIVIHNTLEFNSVSNTAKSIIVLSNTCNEMSLTEFLLPGFDQLESISIGDNCFQNVREFHLNQMNELKSLVIGNNSFANNNFSILKSFSISNCSKLELIEINSYAFREYFSMQLSGILGLMS